MASGGELPGGPTEPWDVPLPDRDSDLFGDQARIDDILQRSKLWFIVGLSTNTDRPAYRVAAVLAGVGKQIVPIHPSAPTVHGSTGYRSIAEAAAALGAPDVVDVFVRSELAGAVADDAIAASAGAVWFQLEVVDVEAAHRVRAAGIDMVMDRCPAIELRRQA